MIKDDNKMLRRSNKFTHNLFSYLLIRFLMPNILADLDISRYSKDILAVI